MRFKQVRIANWRNFRQVDIVLERRAFLVGPNASGKSNLLDALRFLRDVADPRGGFQRAMSERHGVSQIRSLHARQHSNVVIDVAIELDDLDWRYLLEFNQDNTRRPVVRNEGAWRNGDRLLSRADESDLSDPQRFTQTHLEQVNANRGFRPIAEFLAQVRYPCISCLS